MRITIYRGAHQIGGCCTEIRTERARILIDLGQELPKSGEEQSLLTLPGITTGDAECDGVFFTHYHGDHIGLLDTILPDIPVYIEVASKDICAKLYRRLAIHDPAYSAVIDRLESAIPLIPSHPVQIGDLRTFPSMPLAAFIVGSDGNLLVIPTISGSGMLLSGGGTVSVIFSWSGSTVSWYGGYPDSHMNRDKGRYAVIAFYTKS